MATLSDFGIPGLKTTGILHPKHKHKWRVTFAGLGDGTDSRPVSMQAVNVTRPQFSFDEVELHRYNSMAYVAGKHRFESMNLTIEDDISSTATNAIQEQLQKQQWLVGVEGAWLQSASEGSLYKFVTVIDMLDGSDQQIESWILSGCWIQNVDYTELDYSTSDAVQINLTIRYDIARQDIQKYSGGQGSALGGAGKV